MQATVGASVLRGMHGVAGIPPMTTCISLELSTATTAHRSISKRTYNRLHHGRYDTRQAQRPTAGIICEAGCTARALQAHHHLLV